MRQLLNAFVTLTLLIIGFAHLHPARATFMFDDVEPPALISFSIFPIMWFENEDLGFVDTSIVVEAFDMSGPADINLSTDGPINIQITIGIDLLITSFSYAAFTGEVGDFIVTAVLTDIEGNVAEHTIDYLIKPAPVPEPSTLLVFVIGLAGLGFMSRWRSMAIGEAKDPS